LDLCARTTKRAPGSLAASVHCPANFYARAIATATLGGTAAFYVGEEIRTLSFGQEERDERITR
jgi:hypothetical protein